jgi:hypothetical protein
VTNTPEYHFDPEGLLPPDHPFTPKVETIEDEVDKAYTLVINGLTKEQFDILSKGVVDSLKQDPRSRVGMFVGKAVALATMMILLAGAIRVIVWILSGLTINA